MQVFSNLPGPTEQLVFCGETVTGMQIIFPNLIPQVTYSIYSTVGATSAYLHIA